MTAYSIIQQHKPFKTNPPEQGVVGFGLPVSGWYTDYKDPGVFASDIDMTALFREILEHKGVSDISICSGYPVTLKIKGRGVYAITHRVISFTEAEAFAKFLTGSHTASKSALSGTPASGQAIIYNDSRVNHSVHYSQDLKKAHLVKYRYEITGATGINKPSAFNIILRPLAEEPFRWDDIGIEEDFCQACMLTEGLAVLAAGTGQGKTTTLGAVLRRALETPPDDPNFKVVTGFYYTHEDPIENDFSNIQSSHSTLIASQIGASGNIADFYLANKSGMRRSPDLILVGELRDEETVASAVELAFAGCGVMATTHANNIAAILPRLITCFPPALQSQKAGDILQATKLMASQRLIWMKDLETGGLKRKSIREYLVITPELRDYLSNFTSDLPTLYRKLEIIADKDLFGVRSFTTQAKELKAQGLIDDRTYHFLANQKREIAPQVRAILDEL